MTPQRIGPKRPSEFQEQEKVPLHPHQQRQGGQQLACCWGLPGFSQRNPEHIPFPAPSPQPPAILEVVRDSGVCLPMKRKPDVMDRGSQSVVRALAFLFGQDGGRRRGEEVPRVIVKF